MKPIIVTYSNESWSVMGMGQLHIHSLDGPPIAIPHGIYFTCESGAYPPVFKDIFVSDIKLIARPNK